MKSQRKLLESFIKSHDVTRSEVFKKKKLIKETFISLKKSEEKYLENIFSINLPKILSSIMWKKSMRWGDNELVWGRPLRSIFSIFGGKNFKF